MVNRDHCLATSPEMKAQILELVKKSRDEAYARLIKAANNVTTTSTQNNAVANSTSPNTDLFKMNILH